MSEVARIALAGCGAVATAYYAPVLSARARAGRLSLVAAHDVSAERMSGFTALFPEAAACPRFEDVFEAHPDLLIIASPPAAHASQALAALARGVAVLCEKPLAPTLTEALSMAEAAERSGRLLAVGMIRRHFPASRIIRRMTTEGGLGALVRADVFEGGPFRWPVSSPAYFSHQVSGGGVLADIGPHVLDLLRAWLGPLQLRAAEDDAMGGVEANARLTLSAGDSPVEVRLSRDWARPNQAVLAFERGSLIWENDFPERARLRLRDGGELHLSEPGPPADFLSCFGAQLDAVLAGRLGLASDLATAADLTPTVALVEQAYRERRPMTMPWLEPHA